MTWILYPSSTGGFYRQVDVRSAGVNGTNSASANATTLQALIDANTASGAILHFAEPIACDPITLKSNVHLRGNNLAAFKGSKPDGGGAPGLSAKPAGAAFLITNTSTPFCKMQSNTSVDGFVLHYPSQNFNATSIAGSTTYPATFAPDTLPIEGISLSRLCFTGATKCISFQGTDRSTQWVADLAIDLCYGYPLGSYFIAIDNALDIPRVTRCHVNPGVGFQFLGANASGPANCPYTSSVMNDIKANATETFRLYGVDEFFIEDCFCYWVKTAFSILSSSYGNAIGCSADQCATGMFIDPTRHVSVLGFSAVAVTTGFSINGTAGNAKLVGCVVDQASVGVAIAGSGATQVELAGCSAHSVTTAVSSSNGSAVVTGTFVTF